MTAHVDTEAGGKFKVAAVDNLHIEFLDSRESGHVSQARGLADDAGCFPDGGAKAWLTAIGGFISFIATIGFLTGGSVFQSYYATTTLPSSSSSDIAWIGSAQVWGCFFFGTVSGRLSDKYGPTLPLAIGTVVMVFGTMMASISTKYYQFLLSQGFCVALGMGFAFTPALAIQSQWFLKRRGFAVGFVMSGQNIGGVIWPILVNNLLNVRGISLGWTLRIIGFMQLALMIVAIILIQPRFPRNSEREILPLKHYFTDRRTVVFTAAIFVMNLGIYVPWFFVTPFALQQGASVNLAFYDAAILNAGAFFGCYALGIIADIGLGFFNALSSTTLICGIVGFAWIAAKSTPGFIVWAIVYGLLSGALQAIFSPCISLLAPTPETIGSWNGICITIASFAVLVTGPIAGQLLIDSGGTNYLSMQVFTGATLIVSGVLFLVTRIWVSKKPWV